jgi:hypothetical protein
MDRPRPASKPFPKLAAAVALLLLVAAGAGAWRFLADGGARDAGASVPKRDARGDAAPVAPESAPPESAEAHGPSREAEPADRLSTGLPADTPARDALTIEVARDDGKPVTGAEVYVVDLRDALPVGLLALSNDRVELQRKALARLRADATGLVRVARRGHALGVFGFMDGRRGGIVTEPGVLGPQKLLLLAPIELAIRVVDADASPEEGIDVALLKHDGGDPALPLLRATTGADGLARITDVDFQLSQMRQRPSERQTAFEAGFAFPLVPNVVVPVPFDPPPASPIVLTMPETGALELQLVDEEGDPLALAGTTSVLAGPASNAGAQGRRKFTAPSVDVALDEHGHGRLARFGLGLIGSVHTEVKERDCRAVDFTGPAAAGESVEVKLVAKEIGPIVVGRALGVDGMPLAALTLDAQLDRFDIAKNGADAGSAAAAGPIEADGAFRLDFSRSHFRSGPDYALQFHALAVRDPDPGSAAALEARSDVTIPERGVVDVGTLTFAPPPLIASGTVVDDDERPVEDALVVVGWDSKEPIPYRRFHIAPSQTREDGRFEVRGETPPARLTLRAMCAGYLRTKPVPVDVGSTGVTLQLKMGGEVDGSVALPDGFARELLSVRLTLGDDRQVRNLEGDGSFRFERIARGLADVDLLLGKNADTAEVLASIHQVAIHPAEITRDPRLQPIDLAALVHLVDVTVRVPGGELAAGGAIGRRTNVNGNRGTLSVPLASGHAIVPCPTVPVQLQAVVPGFLAESFRGTDAPIDLLLHHGYPLRLQVRGALAKFPDFVALRVSAIPRDDAIASVGPAPSGPIQDGEATLVVPSTGRYRARIEFGPPPDPNASPDDARRRDRRTPRSDVDFEVKDVANEQVVELKVKG